MKITLLIFLILACFLCGCSEKLVESSENLKISDMSGKELELKKAPERAIFLSGESWIYALGIKEKVVAVSDNAKMNPILLKLDPGVSKIPSVGDMNRVNESAILGDPAFSNVEAVKRKAVFKESFLPMQFLEPYFLLTVLQYRNWIIGDVDLEEESLIKEIYRVDL
ncbi:MAG: hypothetical protein QXY19_01375 [Archaeoglobaceae archaeon]